MKAVPFPLPCFAYVQKFSIVYAIVYIYDDKKIGPQFSLRIEESIVFAYH